MSVWAIADLHLCFGTPEKTMEFFGTEWKDYSQRIKDNWEKNIKKEDLVLIAGDISWSKDLTQAQTDLQWIHNLPGTKLLIKGNHDYWWGSKKKLETQLPSSIHFIQKNAYHFNDITIGGTRLWDNSEFNFNDYINYKKNPHMRINPPIVDNEKVFSKELQRLIQSLEQLDQKAKIKIAMTHYPPIGAELKDSRTSKILEQYNIDICVFGHLHHIKKEKKMFGEKNNVKYLLTSSDFLNFFPLKIC